MVLLFGLLTSAALMSMSLSRTPKVVMWCSVAAGVFSVAQYFLLQEFTTVMIAGVNIVRAGIGLWYLHARKTEPGTVTLGVVAAHVILFFTFVDYANLTAFSFIPLCGALLLTFALRTPNMVHMKLMMIASNILWLMFEFHVGAYGQMVGEVFILGGNIYACYMIAKAAKQKSVTRFESVRTEPLPVIA